MKKIESEIEICPFCGEDVGLILNNNSDNEIMFSNIVKNTFFIITIFLLLTVGYFLCDKISFFAHSSNCNPGIEHLNNAYTLYLPRFQRSY